MQFNVKNGQSVTTPPKVAGLVDATLCRKRFPGGLRRIPRAPRAPAETNIIPTPNRLYNGPKCVQYGGDGGQNPPLPSHIPSSETHTPRTPSTCRTQDRTLYVNLALKNLEAAFATPHSE